jgi:MFS family permease
MTNSALVAEEPIAAPGAAAEDTAGAWPRPAYAWYVVVVLLVAYGFAILDRTAIGLLVDSIKRDLHITDSQIGLLQGLAFALCYTTCGLPLGFLADRWRRKPLLAIGIAVWSAATALCGAAGSFGMLFLARIGVGVGEASVTPSSSSLIADYFPPERRAKAYGVWMLGSSLGAGMASLFTAGAIVLSDHLHASGAPWAAHFKTWQITFFLIGAPGLAVALLFALTVREPVRRGVRLAADGSALVTGVSLKPLWAVMKTNRQAYFALMGGAVLNVTAIYAQIGWLPALYMRVHHWSPAKVGAMSGLFNLPVAMSGAIVAGWTMSYLIGKGRNDAPILMAMADAAVRLVIGTAACLAPRPEITLALIVIAGVTSTWSYAAAMTGLNSITPNELRGQVTALYTLCTGLISMTLGSFIVGFLSDHLFQGPGGVAGSLATTFAGCSVLALMVLIPGRKFYAAAEARVRMVEPAA